MPDQDLPMSFWGPVADASPPVQANDVLADQPNEVDSWRPSFAQFNTTPELAMERLYGKVSEHVGGHVLTLEHAFQHLRLEDAAVHKVDLGLIKTYDAQNPCQHIKGFPCGDCGLAVDPANAKTVATNAAREKSRAKAARVAAASTAWRQAVSDRKAAMAQWDAYVASLHAIFTAARSS